MLPLSLIPILWYYQCRLAQLSKQAAASTGSLCLQGGSALCPAHPWYNRGLAFPRGLGPLTDVTLLVRIILTLYLVIGTL